MTLGQAVDDAVHALERARVVLLSISGRPATLGDLNVLRATAAAIGNVIAKAQPR